MKNIFSNIKHIALSLLVVGLAISTQAFRNTEKVSRFDKVYYHVGNQYLIAPPVGTTCREDELPCEITFLPANQPSNDNPIAESSLSGLTYSASEDEGSYQ